MIKKTIKKIKGWAIMPSLSDSKELERYPFLTDDHQFMVYLTKKAAEKYNEGMDEDIEPCEIVFNNNK